MPVDANFFAGGFHDFVDGEFHEVECAVGSGVADGVAKNDGACAVSNGGRIQTLHSIGIGSNGVFRDVHGRKAVFDGELYRFLCGALEVINRPIFHEAANGTGTEKSRGFDGDARVLRNFDDRANIILMRARRAVGLDLPAAGRPILTASIPRDSIRCRISIFSSMLGSKTEGFCKPSRRVSSFIKTRVPEESPAAWRRS